MTDRASRTLGQVLRDLPHGGGSIAGETVSRHLIKTDELATADPADVVRLLRPCVLSLAAQPRRAVRSTSKTSSQSFRYI
jgi:hypothetical protein